jgi:hypothetical protein
VKSVSLQRSTETVRFQCLENLKCLSKSNTIELKMKTAVYYAPDDVRIEQVPVPDLEEDELLVEMKACGICGSDLHMVEGKMGFGSRLDWMIGKPAAVPMILTFPRVMGHEASGVIAEIGKEVKGDFKVGQIPPLWDGQSAERIAEVLAYYQLPNQEASKL